jgi:hypothetical protein
MGTLRGSPRRGRGERGMFGAKDGVGLDGSDVDMT